MMPLNFWVQTLQQVSFIDLGSPASGGAFELSATDPLVAPPAGLTPNTPDQIHVTLGGEGLCPYKNLLSKLLDHVEHLTSA